MACLRVVQTACSFPGYLFPRAPSHSWRIASLPCCLYLLSAAHLGGNALLRLLRRELCKNGDQYIACMSPEGWRPQGLLSTSSFMRMTSLLCFPLTVQGSSPFSSLSVIGYPVSSSVISPRQSLGGTKNKVSMSSPIHVVVARFSLKHPSLFLVADQFRCQSMKLRLPWPVINRVIFLLSGYHGTLGDRTIGNAFDSIQQ